MPDARRSCDGRSSRWRSPTAANWHRPSRPGSTDGWESNMIVVTGSVVARQDSFAEMRRLSLEHVQRSRQENGCISHAVHVDCENALRLVFIEQWADRAALLAHFAVPASRDFVRALQPLASSAATIELYDATRLENP